MINVALQYPDRVRALLVASSGVSAYPCFPKTRRLGADVDAQREVRKTCRKQSRHGKGAYDGLPRKRVVPFAAVMNRLRGGVLEYESA